MSDQDSVELKDVPLAPLHEELGARMVPFAGYRMPVQYPDGILKEHLHTRERAGLFDVSHMGQVLVTGDRAAAALEGLVPADLVGLAIGAQVYTIFTNPDGGILDDLIVMRWAEDRFFLVVNAACKDQDFAHLRAKLSGCDVDWWGARALLALQGPGVREVIAELAPDCAGLVFMTGKVSEIDGIPVHVTCSGYTGEDGFELSVAADAADALARRLLAYDAVRPIGLGARDSLRLEAGLCLYGHDMNTDTTPVEASIAWSIAKVRRPGGAREGGFPGSERIFEQMSAGAPRRRVGLRVDGRAPVREGATILDLQGEPCGEVCSGGFGPSVGAPVAMAYVNRDLAKVDTALQAQVRGKSRPVTVTKMPFVPQRYFRG